MSETEFKYSIGDRVKMVESEESGAIVGRAEYAHTDSKSYHVRYADANGVQSKQWWEEQDIEPAPD